MKEKIWDLVSTRALGAATKVAMALVLSQKATILLNWLGYHPSSAEIQTTVPVVFTWLIERLHHSYDVSTPR